MVGSEPYDTEHELSDDEIHQHKEESEKGHAFNPRIPRIRATSAVGKFIARKHPVDKAQAVASQPPSSDIRIIVEEVRLNIDAQHLPWQKTKISQVAVAIDLLLLQVPCNRNGLHIINH